MGAENDFVGNIDLLTMEALTYPTKDDKGNDTLGSLVVRGPIPEEYQEQAEEYREALVEAAAEGSDELTEAYLENGDLTLEQIKEGIRLLTISSRAFPVSAVPLCATWACSPSLTPSWTSCPRRSTSATFAASSRL